jgi:hypothetical protein
MARALIRERSARLASRPHLPAADRPSRRALTA